MPWIYLIIAGVFGLVFDLDLLPIAGPLLGVLLLGSLGLCSVGTLFAAVAVRTRFREVMLPLLLLPLLIPVLLGAVRATATTCASSKRRRPHNRRCFRAGREGSQTQRIQSGALKGKVPYLN